MDKDLLRRVTTEIPESRGEPPASRLLLLGLLGNDIADSLIKIF